MTEENAAKNHILRNVQAIAELAEELADSVKDLDQRCLEIRTTLSELNAQSRAKRLITQLKPRGVINKRQFLDKEETITLIKSIFGMAENGRR